MSRLAASPWPAAPPAPTRVWASSMNRTMGLGDAFTASITSRRRRSNSPFMLAPAWSRPRSRERRVTSLSAGGTSPAAMRRAKPSATAVLPTPASPARIGLFWRRRIRMSMHCRISSSRPRIGSILPARACSVRSTVNCSSAPPACAGAAPSGPGAGACAAVAASSLPSVSAEKSRLSPSADRRRTSPERSPRRRASPSSASIAHSRWPERIAPAPASTEARSQACFISSTRSGAKPGGRALPLRSRSRTRSRSAVRRPASTSARFSTTATSEPGWPTRRRSQCSTSTL